MTWVLCDNSYVSNIPDIYAERTLLKFVLISKVVFGDVINACLKECHFLPKEEKARKHLSNNFFVLYAM